MAKELAAIDLPGNGDVDLNKVARVKAMAAQARASKLWIAVLDVRYITAGIPTEITDDYILFEEPWELDSTGKLGSDEAKGEKGLTKMLFWGALIHVELMKPIKGAK